jgi:hypothetical protein
LAFQLIRGGLRENIPSNDRNEQDPGKHDREDRVHLSHGYSPFMFHGQD